MLDNNVNNNSPPEKVIYCYRCRNTKGKYNKAMKYKTDFFPRINLSLKIIVISK